MKLSHFCLAVLTAIPLVAQAAEPGVYANASLSGLSYRLIDLTPDDGIAPTVTFGPSWGVMSVAGLPDAENMYPMSSSGIDLGETGFTPLAPVSVALTGANASADSARVVTASVIQSADLIKNLDPGTRIAQSIYAGDIRADVAIMPLISEGNITLGANTGIIITGMGHIAGQFDSSAVQAALEALPNSREAWVGWGQASASVHVSLSQRTTQVDEAGNLYSESEIRSGFSLTRDVWSESFDHSSPFSLQFLNLGNEADEVSLNMAVSARTELTGWVDFRDPADIVIPPPVTPGVPEPGTYLLMGLGLVGLAFARRRAAH